jgi:hypothetical protein
MNIFGNNTELHSDDPVVDLTYNWNTHHIIPITDHQITTGQTFTGTLRNTTFTKISEAEPFE